KGVSLMCQAPGNCIITHGSGQAILFDTLSGTNNHLYRISGFTFKGGSGFVIWFDGNGEMTQIRIDHNTFNPANDAVAIFFGDTAGIGYYYGVIDHNSLAAAGSVSFIEYIGTTDSTPPASPQGT